MANKYLGKEDENRFVVDEVSWSKGKERKGKESKVLE